MQTNTNKSKGMRDTNIRLKSHCEELLAYEDGGVKDHFQAGEEEANLLFPLGHFIQASCALESRLLSPIQEKSI